MGSRILAIDGTRVIAVLLVFMYHSFSPWFQNGGVGVDVFFTISGFVIANLLLREFDRAGTMDLRRFYVARWRRLMPALTFVVAGVLTLSFLEGDVQWIPALLAITYTTDFFAAVAGPIDGSALNHTWSLAVEEQFYLVWPVVLLFLLRRRALVRWVFLGVLVAGPLLGRLALVLLQSDPANRVYFAPDTRLDQLVLGAVLAIFLHEGREVAHRLGVVCLPIGAVGLLLVATTINQRHSSHAVEILNLSFGPTVNALLTVCLLYGYLAAPRHPLTRLLAMRPLAWAGQRLSYGFYLWHYPVIHALTGRGVFGAKLVVSGLLCTAVASVVSWWLVERRFHKPRTRTDLSLSPEGHRSAAH